MFKYNNNKKQFERLKFSKVISSLPLHIFYNVAKVFINFNHNETKMKYGLVMSSFLLTFIYLKKIARSEYYLPFLSFYNLYFLFAATIDI